MIKKKNISKMFKFTLTNRSACEHLLCRNDSEQCAGRGHRAGDRNQTTKQNLAYQHLTGARDLH